MSARAFHLLLSVVGSVRAVPPLLRAAVVEVVALRTLAGTLPAAQAGRLVVLLEPPVAPAVVHRIIPTGAAGQAAAGVVQQVLPEAPGLLLRGQLAAARGKESQPALLRVPQGIAAPTPTPSQSMQAERGVPELHLQGVPAAVAVPAAWRRPTVPRAVQAAWRAVAVAAVVRLRAGPAALAVTAEQEG